MKNPMTPREMADVLLAHGNGKKIECRYLAGSIWAPISPLGIDMDMHFNFAEFEYRIVPEPEPPRYRPWEPSEVPPIGTVLRSKKTGCEYAIVGRDRYSTLGAVLIGAHPNWLSAKELFAGFTMFDGSPCGVLE